MVLKWKLFIFSNEYCNYKYSHIIVLFLNDTIIQNLYNVIFCTFFIVYIFFILINLFLIIKYLKFNIS